MGTNKPAEPPGRRGYGFLHASVLAGARLRRVGWLWLNSVSVSERRDKHGTDASQRPATARAADTWWARRR